MILYSPYCPVIAWTSYATSTVLHPNGPAFITSTGAPLTAMALTKTIRLTLAAVGHPAPGAFTLHSLRRGGAQACAQLGPEISNIQDLGTGRSQAVHQYVLKNPTKSAPLMLSTTFG